jgi:hypothetical protein
LAFYSDFGRADIGGKDYTRIRNKRLKEFMKIFVKVRSGTKKEKIEKIDQTHFVVFVKERPIKGQANKAVIRVLADYFKVSKSEVQISFGLTSPQKTIQIKGLI